MKHNDVIVGKASPDEFRINPIELEARIGSKYCVESLEKLIQEHNKAAHYKYAYTEFPIRIDDDVVDLGFINIKSSSISKVLEGCERAILIALSSGLDVDRLISKKHYLSDTDAFLLDAIASAAVESFADYVCANISKNKAMTRRFSPGYSDFSIEVQPAFLDSLDAHNTVGIALTDSFLMIPAKSITAIIGIKKDVYEQID